MEEVALQYFTILSLLGFCYLAWTLRNVGRRPPNFPPGPPALPILGNIHQVSVPITYNAGNCALIYHVPDAPLKPSSPVPQMGRQIWV